VAPQQPPVPVLPVRLQARRQAQRLQVLQQLPVVARLAQLRARARVAVVAGARAVVAVVADAVPQRRKVRRRPLLVSSC